MFEQSMIVDGAKRSNPWSFAASFTVQTVAVAAVLVLPLLRVATMEARFPTPVYLPRALAPQTVMRQESSRGSAPSTILVTQPGRTYRTFTAPPRIPTSVSMGPDLPNAPEYQFGGGGMAGNLNGIDLGIPIIGPAMRLPPPPPPPVQHAATPAAQPSIVQIGGKIQAAKLVFGPKPVYPSIARQARISGSVRLAAQISADGHIRDLRLISGHPLLAPAAIDAVRQWVYQPTLLNGKPCEVLTDIEVNFLLN